MRLTLLVLIWGMFLSKSAAQLLEPAGQNSVSAQEKGTENRYQRKLRAAREKGGLIADRNLTNVGRDHTAHIIPRVARLVRAPETQAAGDDLARD